MSGFLDRFERGQSGHYSGLDNGLGSINKYIYGVQRKWYYLIGGLSSTGKTVLVDSMLQAAIRDAEDKGIELDVFYYSYEIDAETKFAQWLSNHIYNKHNIVVSPEEIAGYGDYRLPNHLKELVKLEIPCLERIFNKINFRFDPTNPTGVYKELFDFYDKRGTWEKETYKSIDESGRLDANGNLIEITKERIIGYKDSNPQRYMIVVIDHIALTKSERKFSLKENIDKLSEYFIWLRNICGTTLMVLQQFNNGLNTVDRKKYSGEDLLPQQNDFKDSSNPFQDCDTALGIMNPHKMNSNSTIICGYSMEKIKRNFRIINIIKNRKGADCKVGGYYFNPSIGTFKKLPDPKSITDDICQLINNGSY